MRRTRVLLSALLGLGILAPGSARAQCAACTEASFGPAVRAIGAGFVYEYAVAVADFDGDGIPDIATDVSQGVLVFPGLGDGNFGAGIRTDVPSISGSTGFAPGDFNGDGKPDLVVGLYTGEIVLLLGGGNGRFMAAPATGLVAMTFRVGDVDGDGRLDVVALTSASEVVVLRGDGHGNFTPLAGVPASGQYLTVGDLNGDGFADAVLTGGSPFAVLLGSGAGLGPPALIPTYASLSGVVIGDVTGDGKPDVVGTSNWPSNTVIFPGDGAGGFGAAIDLTIGSWPTGYAVADLDGDGAPDLAARGYQYGELVIRLGDGVGGFGPPRTINVPNLSTLVVEDLDGDGVPDFVTGGGYVNVTLGDGTGAGGILSTPAGEEANSILVADFDGDGKADLATAEGWVPNFVRIRKGHGDGTWEVTQDFPVSVVGAPLAALDLNGDGKVDLALQDEPTTFRTVLNDGTGHFTTGTTGPVGCQPFPSRAVADFNGDGRLDLALSCNGAIALLMNDGAGGFGAPLVLATGARWIAAGDVNNDGKADLIWVSPLSVSLGDGHGNFSAPIASSVPSGFGGIAVADFDGDGFLDVASDTFQNGYFVTIVYGDGTGRFLRPRSFPNPASGSVVLSADLNGDGRPDVVTASYGLTGISMNDGSGGLLPARNYSAGANSVAAGNVDGDGLLDLVALQARPPHITTLLNTSCRPRHLAFLPATHVCSTAGAPIAPSPAVRVLDDGGNLITCATGSVTASLVAGTSGAVLSGTTAAPIAGGIASFADLRVNLPGAYRLGFAHSGAARSTAGGVRIGSGVSVSVSGPPLLCGSDPAVYDAGPGFVTYAWLLDGEPVGFSRQFFAPFLGPGAHTLTVVAGMGVCEGTASASISNAPPTLASIAPTSGSPGGFTPVTLTGTCLASAATFSLAGINGHSISSPASTSLLGLTPSHLAGTVDVVVTNPDGQAATLPAAFTYLAGTGAYTLPPCRILDTRLPASFNGLGGPALRPHMYRAFGVIGACGIPPGAVALIVNATVTQPSAAGGIMLNGLPPTDFTNFVSFAAGQTRANNGILAMPLNEYGAIYAYNDSPGTVHFILDVTGYFY